ncbi:MAG: hypothetical protein OEW89_08540 [Gammaproteobacteria bacterium]|nr:hypothetical protein [Gammaproteobacteria bacterium]
MYSSSNVDMASTIHSFKVDGMMLRYSLFVPKLYNFCKSLGFEAGKIMPSRAFCSDESQGYPIILIAKHFGTFPFNHGRVGGIVSTDRHGPHAHHGKDLVIINASHVGFDPSNNTFGIYRRLQTENHENTPTCGKISHVIEWYLQEYNFACENIFLEKKNNRYLITIDNQILNKDKKEGLFLNIERMVELDRNGKPCPEEVHSISRSYIASSELKDLFGKSAWNDSEPVSIGKMLKPELFSFRRHIEGDVEGKSHLEINLLNVMPWIVTSPAPLLTAAQVNTQVEFDRTFRTIIKEPSYRNKKILYIAGIHIDISPAVGQIFPLTKFLPWAAYIQQEDGSHMILEQKELMQRLNEQSTENLDQINLEDAIHIMEDATEVKIPFPL